MWEHKSLTLRTKDFPSGKPRPFVEASEIHMEKVREMGHLGFECVGVTTLHDGGLFMMFKRPLVEGDKPAEVEGGDGVSVGQYL